MTFAPIPRTELGFWPTPIEPMARLGAQLGLKHLWVKRDDQTGLACGGNKVRKLELLMGRALAEGCDAVITAGAAQSNHCRQTAAAAARLGLACHLLLGGDEPARATGNLLLDRLLGATVHWSGPQRKGERLEGLAEELRAAGLRPMVIPYGGSNATGAAAFALAMEELDRQQRAAGVRFEAVVVASSSGGTQAGMVVGARALGMDCQIIGVAVDKEDLRGPVPMDARLASLANEAGALLGVEVELAPHELRVDGQRAEPGYGVITDAEREAVAMTARAEGLLLDPVYSGRAMAHLISLAREGALDPEAPILFWHTGGAPALFHYGDGLILDHAQRGE